jgi:hypothetical protein
MNSPSRRAQNSKSSGSKAKSSDSDKADRNPELQSSDLVGTAIVTGLTFGQKALQYAVVDGRAIFEGDIDLAKLTGSEHE